ncbi:AMP-binding protein [Plantactinospora sp. KBS50]|uniref:AMP-binding protein n=1 Tax=Plantactinospora sp. KBS50 TaxID=2024580 RepID=UPI000BAB08D0|nr:AMP-binding protein [Plantactinospora sp. KBS50]ASW55615.1 AMP-dependent synthetase [Plantactinospora sp. KBS50]
MSGTVLDRVIGAAPTPGHHLRVARLDGTTSIELADLHARAGRLAAALHAEGIRAGDRIGILAANGLEWVLLDLAALHLKAVTAGFEPGKFEADGGLIERYGLRTLFTDRPATGPGIRAISEVTALAARPGTIPPARWERQEATTIKFTSGSTGEPKGLAASAGSIDGSLRAVQQMFAHGPADDIFVFLPLSLLQQRYWVYSALAYGHDVTISSYAAVFAVLRRTRPSVVMGVPGFFETARRHIEEQARRGGTDPASAARALFGDRIRYLWTGSAPAAPATLEFFDACGLPIYEGYGLNETCIVSKNCPGASRRGSVGRVLPGKRVIIGDDGVISVHSDDPVGLGYTYAAPGESERIFGPDGTVRTGDLGHLDEDGFLYIEGRADDVIVLDNGRKVIVRPIEERLRASPLVAQAVVFCPTQSHLVAVLSPTGSVDRSALAAHLSAANAALARDEQVRRVVVADEPFSIDNGLLTSQYKPRRKQIFARYAAAITAKGDGVHVQ